MPEGGPLLRRGRDLRQPFIVVNAAMYAADEPSRLAGFASTTHGQHSIAYKPDLQTVKRAAL